MKYIAIIFGILSAATTSFAHSQAKCNQQTFYCADGYIHDLDGKSLDYISGGQSECLKAIVGSMYCADGYVYNSSATKLNYISGGQAACIKAVSGSMYCADGYVFRSDGTKLNYPMVQPGSYCLHL